MACTGKQASGQVALLEHRIEGGESGAHTTGGWGDRKVHILEEWMLGFPLCSRRSHWWI